MELDDAVLASLMTGGYGAAVTLPSEGLPGIVRGPVTPVAAAALFALGALSTALATVVFFHLVGRAGPTFMSLINYLIPVWAVLLGAVVLDERLPARAFAALGLILGGVVLSRFQGRPREAGA